MAAVIAALIAVLLVPVSYGSDACADVHLIGARGSGQPEGFGPQAGPVVDTIEASLQARGLSVEAAPLDYPAISVSDSFGLVLLTGDYARSVRAGVIELIAEMTRVARECPQSDLVLVGYSQGAQVIKVALEDLPPVHRVSGVVLLADPTRDRSQLGIARLGDPAVERSGSFGAVALPDHFRSVTVDFCADGDGVCERGRSSLVAHVEGYVDAPSLIVPFIEAEFDDRLRTLSGLR